MLLAPYTVLDFTDERGELGPMLMGDLGADVIKVELEDGSDSRRLAPFADGAPEDLRSLSFQAFNRNKRSIVLDPASGDDRAVLENLIQQAHFVFEPAPNGALSSFGMSYSDVEVLNPQIVFVQISAFGNDGPHAELAFSDLTIAALAGPVALQGVVGRAPVRVTVPQVWRHTGVEAASGALVAHHRRLKTGRAQFVDLSAQNTMTWTMLNSMGAFGIQGANFQRCGLSFPLAEFDLVYPCADGWLVALPSSKVMMGCLPLMIEEGIADESWLDMKWEAYDQTMRDFDAHDVTVVDGSRLLHTFFAKRTKQELFEFGLAQGISLAPANTLEELLALDHLQSRDYWHKREVAGEVVSTAGLWAKPSVNGLSIRRPPPALGEHTEEVKAQLVESGFEPMATESSDALPFAGLTVVDFSWVGVGPISTKYLADHGAEVIRIESVKRPDVLRGGPPFKDMEPGLDNSQFYADFNSSKKSIALDMKHPEAIAIARKLIARADIVVESFAPGAITRMGLGYDDIKAINPEVIMVSTCLMGQTGPAAQLAGFGYHAGAIAGFYEVTGWPDLGPSGPWVAYTDTIAPRFISTLLASAIDHRYRTGEGCYFDVAQIETALHFLGPELMDYQLNGISATRAGNRSRFFAPQGCYPCQGEDRWCAIAVDSNVHWQKLCQVIGNSRLADKYKDHSDRLAAHDEIDKAISAWSADLDAYVVMQKLQAQGVPAGVVQRSSDLLDDPQNKHRDFYRYLDHPMMGKVPYAGHQYKISNYDNGPRGPAPMLGEHSFEVLSQVLNLSDEEIAAAYASGAIN